MRYVPKRKASESLVANTLAGLFKIKKTGDLKDTIERTSERIEFLAKARLHAWEEDVWGFLTKPDLSDHSLGQELFMNEGEPLLVRDSIQGGGAGLWWIVIDNSYDSYNLDWLRSYHPFMVVNHCMHDKHFGDDNMNIIIAIKVESICDTKQE